MKNSVIKIIHIVGARPQFIKVVPVIRAIADYNKQRRRNSIESILLHTGQHYDNNMSQVFFEELLIPEPKYHLGIGSESHGRQTAKMLEKIEDVLISEKPDIVLVYGDTNSTLAGALASAKLHIPLAHIEAGLRSHNKKMPEEINRVLTDHCSDILFCPTQTAVENLRKEGFVDGVYWVGDVMYDAALAFLLIAGRKSNILNRLGFSEKKNRAKRYCLATIHRAENTDNPERLKRIFDALNSLAKDENKIIVPLHSRTLKRMKEIKMEKLNSNLCIIEPVSYLDMLLLEKNAQLILTDSGGVQKEAFFLEVPCLTLREETEWVETVESGWNRLVGTDPQGIVTAAEEVFCGKSKGQANINAYGDGQAARKIVEICVNWLKRT